MPAPDIIRDLVLRFEYNKDAYRSHAYNDSKIYRVIHDLYGLTEEEIKIVEGEG